MKELKKTYDPSEIEERRYKKWEKNGYFHAKVDKSKKPFTIVMPPPNITGQLHMGHALDETMQDILIRMKRMQGYEALWQPGTDHAAISTEVKIINALKEQGISKDDLGREGFLKKAWEWKAEYQGRIDNQLKKLGSSADWERERFTMDEGCSKAVEKVFIKLYEKGYIYKGKRIINWCPVCKTTISDAEVEYVEKKGHFWHILYPIAGEAGKYIEIATTRPETMLGDTAVAVNPKDKRYKKLIGKKVILPIVNKEIPVIEDDYVDMEFGTGIVKITPAHDPNDFEVGKRHDLPEINILNDDGTINENGGEYEGLDRLEARERIVERLQKEGLLKEVEDIEHNVGTHDRCRTDIEPMIKPQWFVKMDEMARPALNAVKNGDLTFVPQRFSKVYVHWLENIKDWCISRQLWWGHRIPAYQCADCGHIVVAPSDKAPRICPRCRKMNITQNPDTLDTWFSSALWPFSTLGWPEKTPEYDYFYPTDVLVTGYDIIFFWVVRMVFSGYEQTGKCPFHTVMIHGLIRDSLGRKMSKSLGNGIDPLEVISKYGADALRLTLVTGNSPGNDMRFYWEKVENSRNFANKIWNASRFIMMNLPDGEIELPFDRDFTTADRWIISLVNTLAKDVTENLDKFELGIAVQKVYDFLWDEFCDWYIESVKSRIYGKEGEASKNAALFTLREVLSRALKLLHPFMPFITEEIYCTLHPECDTIMTAAWPTYSKTLSFKKDEEAYSHIKDFVRSIRNVRTEMNVPPSKKVHVYAVSEDAKIRETFTGNSLLLATLAGTSGISVIKKTGEIKGDIDSCVSQGIAGATIYLPIAELVDIEKEKERLTKEKERLLAELKRSDSMLNNERFLSKAPADKVAAEKEKREKYQKMYDDLLSRLEKL